MTTRRSPPSSPAWGCGARPRRGTSTYPLRVLCDRQQARVLTTLRWCVVAMMCRFVTHAGNARSFPLCSLDIIIVAAAEAYAGFRVGGASLNALLGSRHASLYPPSRRRTTLHDLPKL